MGDAAVAGNNPTPWYLGDVNPTGKAFWIDPSTGQPLSVSQAATGGDIVDAFGHVTKVGAYQNSTEDTYGAYENYANPFGGAPLKIQVFSKTFKPGGFLSTIGNAISNPFKQLVRSTEKVFTNPGKANFGDFASALNPVDATIVSDVKHPKDAAVQGAAAAAVAGAVAAGPAIAGAAGTVLSDVGGALGAAGGAIKNIFSGGGGVADSSSGGILSWLKGISSSVYEKGLIPSILGGAGQGLGAANKVGTTAAHDIGQLLFGQQLASEVSLNNIRSTLEGIHANQTASAATAAASSTASADAIKSGFDHLGQLINAQSLSSFRDSLGAQIDSLRASRGGPVVVNTPSAPAPSAPVVIAAPQSAGIPSWVWLFFPGGLIIGLIAWYLKRKNI